MFKPIITVLVLFTLIVSAAPAAPEAVDAKNKDSGWTVRRALPTPELVDSSELYIISNCETERGMYTENKNSGWTVRALALPTSAAFNYIATHIHLDAIYT
ncbi:hypothetical protein C8J57DRAFT_1218673 [Mycena rebaudengoi]|nr:hypothetical protein C8J57DRAFT_1218673 [Mycena rebaudengoi]